MPFPTVVHGVMRLPSRASCKLDKSVIGCIFLEVRIHARTSGGYVIRNSLCLKTSEWLSMMYVGVVVSNDELAVSELKIVHSKSGSPAFISSPMNY